MSRFIDWQRGAVYAGQSRAHWMNRRAEMFMVVDTLSPDFNALQDEIVRHAFPDKQVKVRVKVSSQFSTDRAWARRWLNEVQYGVMTRGYVIAHEVAHLTVHEAYPAHGVEFVMATLELLEKTFGAKEAAAMEEALRFYNVACSYEDRDAYTRKRARWAADGGRVEILLKPEVAATTGQLQLRSHARRTNVGLQLYNPNAPTGSSLPAVMVPYDAIAYIRRR